MKLLSLFTLCATLTIPSQGALIITGVFDGPLSGGRPKGVELFATADIVSLSNFAVGSANNGGGTDGAEFFLPDQPLSAGQFFYVASSDIGFEDFFGFPAGAISNALSINGDDAIELFSASAGETVIDVFGDIGTDGSGELWEYTDGWAYRANGLPANGGTFDAANWTFSGRDALDGESSNAGAASPIPVGTWQVPEPTSALLGAIGVGLLCFLRRKP